MPPTRIPHWLDERSGRESVWYVKRLSGNDTLANGSHQAGPYIPREFLLESMPGLNWPNTLNPRIRLDVSVDSHADRRRASAIWYNNRLHGGTRNEIRLTGFGGSGSALLDPCNTGALSIFAFSEGKTDAVSVCNVWICRTEAEEDIVEERVGPVDPGRGVIWPPDYPHFPSTLLHEHGSSADCRLKPDEIPAGWLSRFPTGADIVAKSTEMRPELSLDPDRRLLRRRECEFAIFRSIEESRELPAIRKGFATMDRFLARAQTVLQRRKSRSGRSLELHAHAIFREEGLCEDRHFSHQKESESGRRPDFLFPSVNAYRDSSFPDDKLRMLAVKTTCRDRWRQILQEADRVKIKHLLTLQEGISEGQFREMKHAGVRLVVPRPLIRKFPGTVRPELRTLERFIAGVRRIAT